LKQKLRALSLNQSLNISDKKIINSLLLLNNFNIVQEKYILNLIEKYEPREKILCDRRATLREKTVYCFGNFSVSEREKFYNIPGREKEKDYYTVPINKHSINILRELNFKLSESILEWERETEKFKSKDFFDERLFPYQIEGVKRLEELNGRALLADSMGLGKSCQVSTFISRNPDNMPILIICPASLKLNWERELRLWGVTEKIKIINGTKDNFPKTGIVIMSYNVVYNYYIQIEEHNFKMLICDESHYLKRPESQRSKAVKYLSKGIEKIILISGTPITARPSELFLQLQMLKPEMFPSREKFLKRYCNLDHDGTGKGCSNAAELHKILTDTFMIRRLKEDVLKDLPPKMYSVIPFEMGISAREKYDFAKNDLISYLRENYDNATANKAIWAEAVVKLSHLRQLAVAGKIDETVEWIRSALEQGEKLVIFAVHKVVINRLMEEFGDIAVKIDGSVSGKQRQENVDRFQKDDSIRLFIGNIQSAGVGITLTAASIVIFVETSWSPGDLTQAIDRVHRIGTTAECINVYYLVSVNSIDEDIARTLDRKSKVLADILDGGEIDENILIGELIEQYKNM
jgi:SWI/SNF-related matrix-associated actin-dependent regulator of chromatin subfamily A-like protein 1